jgi:alpha-L-arabinofuranosidase
MKRLILITILPLALFLACTGTDKTSEQNLIVLDFSAAEQMINKDIYGHFAEHLGRCIYDGIWVGPDSEIPNYNGYRLDVLEALKELKVPVLRWPGGCFADTYHWKNGIGPRDQRPTLLNTFWGSVIEDNSFGTHEFLDLCEILGADAYIAANVGSGTVREMMEWIEYMTSDRDIPMANWRRENGREKPWNVKFIGIGNESWGCGGEMTPEFYADLYRQYSVYARQYGGPNMIRVGCGSYGDYYGWTDVVMEKAARFMEGISLHHYTLPTGDWGVKGPATGFEEDQYFSTLRNARLMDTWIKGHLEVMDKHDPEKRVGLYVDEWGIWTDPEPGSTPGFLFQQNSMRDALVASLTFDIFHNYADRVHMANIAQMVNVLQAMILTEGDRMVLTPTYHVFNMYKVHQDATYIPVSIQSEDYTWESESFPAITGTASTKDGKVSIGISNLHASKTIPVKVDLTGGNLTGVKKATILTAPAFNSFNSWDNPAVVSPAEFIAFNLSNDLLEVQLSPHSVVVIELEK